MRLTLLMLIRISSLCFVFLLGSNFVCAQLEDRGAPPTEPDRVRARYRFDRDDAGTAVSESQAEELTLTLNEVAVRALQTWIRTAGRIDPTGRVLTAYLAPSEAGLVEVGQRVRAFPPSSKFSMFQASVARVFPEDARVTVEVTLSGPTHEEGPYYVIEIVAERGEFLSIPNEAIIEEGDRQVVYVEEQPGRYLPREIQTGLQGELYTEVLGGLDAGEQVVTFGSFFIDAEHKLRSIN